MDKIQAELPENKQLLEQLKLQFIKKFDNVEKMSYLGISTMLDPRFKKLYFKNPVNIANVISSIDNELRIVSRTNIVEQTSFIPTISQENENSIWFEHDSQILSQPSIQDNNPERSERCIYLQAPVIHRKQCPLEFWNKSTLMELKQIAAKWSCVVASSVPSERLFSKCGKVIENRSRLTCKRFEKLVFLSSIDDKY